MRDFNQTAIYTSFTTLLLEFFLREGFRRSIMQIKGAMSKGEK
jgi:ATP phosphoribosyltransferase